MVFTKMADNASATVGAKQIGDLAVGIRRGLLPEGDERLANTEQPVKPPRV